MDDFANMKSLGKAIAGGIFQASSQTLQREAAAEKERAAAREAAMKEHAARQQSMADPWQHRSDGMKCRTCMWFVEKPRDPAKMAPDPRGHLGRCRRHAPTMNGFPAVFTSDWCGDHKMDETKI